MRHATRITTALLVLVGACDRSTPSSTTTTAGPTQLDPWHAGTTAKDTADATKRGTAMNAAPPKPPHPGTFKRTINGVTTTYPASQIPDVELYVDKPGDHGVPSGWIPVVEKRVWSYDEHHRPVAYEQGHYFVTELIDQHGETIQVLRGERN
jgi:hypothetical protein